MKQRVLRGAAVLMAALLLAGCSVSIDGILPGGRRIVRAEGEDHREIDLLLYAEQAGDHTLSIADIHFVDGGVKLTVDPALEDNITLTAPEAVLETVKVSIDHQGGVISVKGNSRVTFADADLEITVGVPVKSLRVEGGVELDANLPEVKAFALQVDGAVDGNVRFGAPESLDVTLNGAGSLAFTGTCARASMTLNGACSLDADDLVCTDAAVTINGAGSCAIHVTGVLDAAVNGVGSIKYEGNPHTVNKSGGGIAAIGGQ